MGRIVIAAAPGAGFGPGALASAWSADGEASAAGSAGLEACRREVFPGLVVPLAANVLSSTTYDLVKRVAARLRPAAGMSYRWSIPRCPPAAGT